jgi:hypothetical protein
MSAIWCWPCVARLISQLLRKARFSWLTVHTITVPSFATNCSQTHLSSYFLGQQLSCIFNLPLIGKQRIVSRYMQRLMAHSPRYKHIWNRELCQEMRQLMAQSLRDHTSNIWNREWCQVMPATVCDDASCICKATFVVTDCGILVAKISKHTHTHTHTHTHKNTKRITEALARSIPRTPCSSCGINKLSRFFNMLEISVNVLGNLLSTFSGILGIQQRVSV